MYNLETDPNINSPEKAEEAIKAKNIDLTDRGKDILYKTEFSHEGKIYELTGFTVEQLGFSDGATTEKIYQKAKELGLELCPAEVGPHLRLEYPGKEGVSIAMKHMTDRGGNPSVFYLRSDGSLSKLSGDLATPSDWWFSDRQFVFLSRPSTELGASPSSREALADKQV